MRRIFALLLVVLSANFLVLPASSTLAARDAGIDVSSYQGSNNWTSIHAAGKDFAWAKATEGQTVNDSTFVANMNNGTAAGVYMGAYHFAHPELHDPATEANHFLSIAGAYLGAGYLRPMLDMEEAGGTTPVGAANLSDWTNDFISDIIAAKGAGAEPVIYCNTNYAQNYFNSTVASRDLDVANYNYTQAQALGTSSPPIGVFSTWAFWQYDSSLSVNGIGSNPVDTDVANGDINFVKSFLIGGTPPPTSFERFDVNGATAGSGVVNNGSYIWESAKYSSTSAGTDAVSWNEGNFLRLAAGTDAGASNYTITANAAHTFAGMLLQTGGGGTVTINGPGVLSIASGDQGFFVDTTSQTLKINAVLAGSGRLVWQGSSGTGAGGSLYLLGNNTYTGGTLLNDSAGLNFNNNNSFGTGLITWGVAQQVLADDVGTAPITLPNAMATRAASQLIYVGPAAAPVTFSGAWTLASGSSELTIGNASHTSTKMTISGNIGGSSGALVKDGVGTLVLSGANTYTGGTTISAGTLQLGNGGTTGKLSTASAIINNGSLVFNRTNTMTQGTDFTGSAISGTGSLTQAGSGTLILNAANSYTGGTTLNAGTLLVNNTTGTGTGTGSVAVSAGSFLGGTGTIQGAVTNSGTVRPGNSVGTLHLSSTYSQASGGQLEIELASTGNDELVVTSTASLAGTLAVSLVGGFVPQEGDVYEIMRASGFGGTAFATTSLPALSGDMVWIMKYGATAVTLSVLLPGDFDGNGTVDASDYVVWLKNVGQPAGTLPNDTTGLAIGSSQYNLWRSNDGKISGTGSGSGSSFGQAAVPEPTAMILGLAGGAALTILPGRRRKRGRR